jgi:uncharacterized UPF0160 family protein
MKSEEKVEAQKEDEVVIKLSSAGLIWKHYGK